MRDNLRIQDMVARTAGVSLRDTVKVLRSLYVVSRVECEDDLANELQKVLVDSAEVNGYPARLQDHPGLENSKACDESHERICEVYSRSARDAAFKLLNCPFEELRIEQEKR